MSQWSTFGACQTLTRRCPCCAIEIEPAEDPRIERRIPPDRPLPPGHQRPPFPLWDGRYVTVQWRAWPSRTPNANAGSGSAAPPASPSARYQGTNQIRVESRGGAWPVGGRWLFRPLSHRAAGRLPWVRFLPPLSEPGGPISGTGLSSGIMRLAHGFPARDQRAGLTSPGTWLAPLRRPGRCVVRPVDALATATARVVLFACACDDIRNSCSSPG